MVMRSNQTDHVLGTFLNLVQIDSPTGHEEKIAKYVQDFLETLRVKNIKDKAGNVIANVDGELGKETFLLNAHLDTVEPGRGIKPMINTDGWVVSSGDTILGADNKSAVAVILEVVRRLSKSKEKSNHPLEVVFTVSEESGNMGASNFDYSKLKSKIGWSSDASNRTFGSLIVSSPFYNRFDIEIEGKSAHASRPDLAVNVLPIFAKTISKLKLGRVNKDTIANIGIVNCGHVVNTIPGSMLLSGEVRGVDETVMERETKLIVGLFSDFAKRDGAKIKARIIRENAGFKFLKTEKVVVMTLQALGMFGIKPELIDSWGCYDANVFAEHGIKLLNIADGSMDAHTSKERVRASDLERMVGVFMALVE